MIGVATRLVRSCNCTVTTYDDGTVREDRCAQHPSAPEVLPGVPWQQRALEAERQLADVTKERDELRVTMLECVMRSERRKAELVEEFAIATEACERADEAGFEVSAKLEFTRDALREIERESYCEDGMAFSAIHRVALRGLSVEAENAHVDRLKAAEAERDAARRELAKRDGQVTRLETALREIRHEAIVTQSWEPLADKIRRIHDAALAPPRDDSTAEKLQSMLNEAGLTAYLHKPGCDMKGGDCSMKCAALADEAKKGTT
jgi:hypothetical protein